MSDFESFGLYPGLVANIRKLGYTKPSPVQQDAIPAVLSGRDVVGSAQTGTGKTAAFALPILHKLRSHGALRCLILTPTRELAAQVEESIRTYAVGTGITSAVIVGGVPMGPQLAALRRGVDILVATPGRLLDHMGGRTVHLDKVEILVLDEMDQMLDMGFVPDVRRIVAALPKKRQTLLFSATVPATVARLIEEITHDPVRVKIAIPTATAEKVEQRVVLVAKEHKKDVLQLFLERWKRQQVLIFTRTKRGAEQVAKFLIQGGHKVALIHGDRSQGQRTTALRMFKTGQMDTMVATSIAARGLDIPLVSHVVNYDLPSTPEEYIHRVGRTARAEATGEAFTFVTPDQGKELRDIERVLGKQIPREPLPKFIPGSTPVRQAPAPSAPVSHAPTNGPIHRTPDGKRIAPGHAPAAPQHGAPRTPVHYGTAPSRKAGPPESGKTIEHHKKIRAIPSSSKWRVWDAKKDGESGGTAPHRASAPSHAPRTGGAPRGRGGAPGRHPAPQGGRGGQSAPGSGGGRRRRGRGGRGGTGGSRPA